MSISGLGVAADIIGVGVFLFGAYKAISRTISWHIRGSHSSVEAYVKSKKKNYRTPSEELRQCHIAIVDDEPTSFPIEHLKAISLNVELFPVLELARTNVLNRFDVVFLDIAGVIPEDMKNGGFEVLKRLRSEGNIDTIVIAVSSKTFKAEVNKFFSLADDVLSKPLKAALTEKALLDLIGERRTVFGISKQCDSLILNDSRTSKETKKIIRAIVKYVESANSSVEQFKQSLNGYHIGSADKLVSFVKKLKVQMNAP